MIKVQYPKDRISFEDSYKKKFPITDIETKYLHLCTTYNLVKSSGFSVESIISSRIETLCDILKCFHEDLQLIGATDKQIKDINNKLRIIFDYDKYYPVISNYFMSLNANLSLHTCHYCNIDYINTYGLSWKYKNELEFVNQASKEELMYYLDIAERTTKTIIKNRIFRTISAFDSMPIWRGAPKLAQFKLDNSNHFYLDHYISRDCCAIFSLSLYNFVPCCANCNSRIKGAGLISDDYQELAKLCPTSHDYNFEKDILFVLNASKYSDILKYRQHLEDYYLSIDDSNAPIYRKEIEAFRLVDRYNYHKIEAVHYSYLRKKYPESQIKEIASLMSKNKNDISNIQAIIHDDIFKLDASENHQRSFSKLKKDMIK